MDGFGKELSLLQGEATFVIGADTFGANRACRIRPLGKPATAAEGFSATNSPFSGQPYNLQQPGPEHRVPGDHALALQV